MQKAALVIPGGGMRNAFTSGFILGAELEPEQFGAVFAASSGGPTAAYFIAKQSHLAENVWVNKLTSPRLFDMSNILRMRFIADIDYLIDDACHSLDDEAVCKSQTKLFVGLFKEVNTETIFVECNNGALRTLLKATCSLPFYARPEYYEGVRYRDGGVEIALPVEISYEMGWRKILVIENHPLTERQHYGIISSFLAFPHSRKARQIIRKRGDRHMEALRFANNPPADCKILIVAPDLPLPIERFTRSKEATRKTIELGMERGREVRDQVHEFLR